MLSVSVLKVAALKFAVLTGWCYILLCEFIYHCLLTYFLPLPLVYVILLIPTICVLTSSILKNYKSHHRGTVYP